MSTTAAVHDLTSASDRDDLRQADEPGATGLINTIIKSPQAAAAAFLRDVEGGADPQAVLALLEGAANLARLRGLHIEPFVRAMRARFFPPELKVRSADGDAASRAQPGGIASWFRGWLPGR